MLSLSLRYVVTILKPQAKGANHAMMIGIMRGYFEVFSISFINSFQVEDLKRSSSASDSKRVSELEQEVQVVNEKVVHYQTVLADTVSDC